jgi:hypothetical protein
METPCTSSFRKVLVRQLPPGRHRRVHRGRQFAPGAWPRAPQWRLRVEQLALTSRTYGTTLTANTDTDEILDFVHLCRDEDVAVVPGRDLGDLGAHLSAFVAKGAARGRRRAALSVG